MVDWKLFLSIPSAIWSTLQVSRTVREWCAPYPLVYRCSLILAGLILTFAFVRWLHGRWAGRVREWSAHHPVYRRSLILAGLGFSLLVGLWVESRWHLIPSVVPTVVASTPAQAPAPLKDTQPPPQQQKPVPPPQPPRVVRPAHRQVQSQSVAPVPPGNTQNCVGSNCVQGPNFGPQTLNQYGPPKLLMSDAQRDAIADAMRPYAGSHFTLFRHDATEDSVKYADQLKQALTAAGLICDRDGLGAEFYERAIPSGVSLLIGSNEKTMAESFAEALKRIGLIQAPMPAAVNDTIPNQFHITVAPNR